MDTDDLYGGRDPRDVPTYTLRQAARYLRLRPSTLHRWLDGVIALPPTSTRMLSFWNLAEAYVLACLRTHHQVPLPSIRRALGYVRTKLGVERPLIDEAFETDGVDLFIERVGFINASREGQLAVRAMFEASLKRVDRDTRGLVERIYPWARDPHEPRDVEIDSRRSFGRLVMAGTGVPIDLVVSRFRGGDTVEALASDYRLSTARVQAALRWELSAQAA